MSKMELPIFPLKSNTSPSFFIPNSNAILQSFGLDSFLEANYACKGLSELTMEVFFQRVLQAGLCSGAQLADSFVFLSQPAHRATQALQLGRVVLAAQTIEAFLGGADVALLTLQFFLNFLEDESMP